MAAALALCPLAGARPTGGGAWTIGWDSKAPPDDGGGEDDGDAWACLDPSSVPAKALLKVCPLFRTAVVPLEFSMC